MTNKLPRNVHISSHPCLRAKLSKLRDEKTKGRETKALIHEISLILGCEATASCLTIADGPEATTSHLGQPYTTQTISPNAISLIPVLRSGLAMSEALQTILPDDIPVHHLGLFRESTTLQPVEYYNKLPYHAPTDRLDSDQNNSSPSQIAIILDPVIATGGTCVASIQTLREWGVTKIIVIGVLGAREGVLRAAHEWEDHVEIWLAGMDEVLNTQGMIVPGLGDVGDRLFLT